MDERVGSQRPLPVIVRPAEPFDAAGIGELSRALARHVDDPDPGSSIDSLLASGFGPNPWFECRVAVIGEGIVGFVLFCRRYEAHTRRRTLWIGDLVVKEGVRSRRIGERLVAAVRGRAAELDCAGITLEVWHENRAALRFYERLDANALGDRHLVFLPLARRVRVPMSTGGESRPDVREADRRGEGGGSAPQAARHVDGRMPP